MDYVGRKRQHVSFNMTLLKDSVDFRCLRMLSVRRAPKPPQSKASAASLLQCFPLRSRRFPLQSTRNLQK